MRRLSASHGDFEASFAALLAARSEETGGVAAEVAAIVGEVRAGGDAALISRTERHDGFALPVDAIRIDDATIAAAAAAVPQERLAALDLAATRIEAFHRAQMPDGFETRDAAGVRMGMRWNALDAVGIYVPGGKAAYPSSVLMNAIPARVAGVGRIAMCVPCPGGVINDLVMAAARRAGVSEIFRVGGAQAIAALAYGTETIAAVDRIVGPGNAWVAEAKRQVFGHVGIDGINGPSEVVILADRTADPRAVAIDLLAQAEHDEAAQAVLVTDSAELADAVEAAVETALATLEREAIARTAWDRHGAIVLVSDWDKAVSISDRLAPEHLQIVTTDPDGLFARIRHAGSVFLGHATPEAIGDYVGGPNHVLPTGRTARFASGLSVFDFLKRTTWLSCEGDSLAAIGPAAVTLAQAEGLQAHARSVALRLDGSPAAPDGVVAPHA